jgi:hypothetical protein
LYENLNEIDIHIAIEHINENVLGEVVLDFDMIEIKPIERHQIADVKNVILRVARNIYRWEANLEALME